MPEPRLTLKEIAKQWADDILKGLNYDGSISAWRVSEFKDKVNKMLADIVLEEILKREGEFRVKVQELVKEQFDRIAEEAAQTVVDVLLYETRYSYKDKET